MSSINFPKSANLDYRRPMFNKNLDRVRSAIFDGAHNRERLFNADFVTRSLES